MNNTRWRESLACTQAHIIAIEARLAILETLVAEHIGRETCAPIRAEVVPQRTATEHQTYSWLPGDTWAQYCAAVDD